MGALDLEDFLALLGDDRAWDEGFGSRSDALILVVEDALAFQTLLDKVYARVVPRLARERLEAHALVARGSMWVESDARLSDRLDLLLGALLQCSPESRSALGNRLAYLSRVVGEAEDFLPEVWAVIHEHLSSGLGGDDDVQEQALTLFHALRRSGGLATLPSAERAALVRQARG